MNDIEHLKLCLLALTQSAVTVTWKIVTWGKDLDEFLRIDSWTSTD